MPLRSVRRAVFPSRSEAVTRLFFPTARSSRFNHLEDRLDASPAIVGNTTYLRGYKHLYAIAEEEE
jgi:hypothetical protein